MRAWDLRLVPLTMNEKLSQTVDEPLSGSLRKQLQSLTLKEFVVGERGCALGIPIVASGPQRKAGVRIQIQTEQILLQDFVFLSSARQMFTSTTEHSEGSIFNSSVPGVGWLNRISLCISKERAEVNQPHGLPICL